MTQTIEVTTKRMAQKTECNITGTGGKVKVEPEPIGEVMIIKPPLTIVTPKAAKVPKTKKKRKKSKK